MLPDELHVLVLGVVLEVGVELVTPSGTRHVQKPDDLIVEEGDRLGHEPVPEEALADPALVDQLLQDQQVPLLVVLLQAALAHAIEHPAREVGERRRVRDRDVGDLLPRLVGHARDQLEHLELAERAPPAVDEVQAAEQRLRQPPVRAPRRCERQGLLGAQLRGRQALHDRPVSPVASGTGTPRA